MDELEFSITATPKVARKTRAAQPANGMYHRRASKYDGLDIPHLFTFKEPSVKCYANGCRCDDCRDIYSHYMYEIRKERSK